MKRCWIQTPTPPGVFFARPHKCSTPHAPHIAARCTAFGGATQPVHVRTLAEGACARSKARSCLEVVLQGGAHLRLLWPLSMGGGFASVPSATPMRERPCRSVRVGSSGDIGSRSARRVAAEIRGIHVTAPQQPESEARSSSSSEGARRREQRAASARRAESRYTMPSDGDDETMRRLGCSAIDGTKKNPTLDRNQRNAHTHSTNSHRVTFHFFRQIRGRAGQRAKFQQARRQEALV